MSLIKYAEVIPPSTNSRRYNMRYKKQLDGEWVTPRMKKYYMKCCDCGLVHRLNFRIIKKTVQFQAFRVPIRATERKGSEKERL